MGKQCCCCNMPVAGVVRHPGDFGFVARNRRTRKGGAQGGDEPCGFQSPFRFIRIFEQFWQIPLGFGKNLKNLLSPMGLTKS